MSVTYNPLPEVKFTEQVNEEEEEYVVLIFIFRF